MIVIIAVLIALAGAGVICAAAGISARDMNRIMDQARNNRPNASCRRFE